jgi:hypothetical protein
MQGLQHRVVGTLLAHAPCRDKSMKHGFTGRNIAIETMVRAFQRHRFAGHIHMAVAA